MVVFKGLIMYRQCGSLEKLHGQERDEATYLKGFENEVHILLEILHHNVVKLQGFCL